jgi:hypothetical protein
MATYEILHVGDDVREWTAKQGPAAGQTFKSYAVRAKCPDGMERNFEVSRKPDSPPPPLGAVEAEVKPSQGDFPDKLKLTPQGRGGGFSGGGAKDAYWEGKGQRDLRNDRRMGRAHAQEMAIRWSAIVGNDRLDQLRTLIEIFDKDVLDAVPDASPNASQDGGVNPPSLPAPSSSAGPSEPATPPQKRAMTNALRKMQCGDELLAAIVHKAAGNPPTKSGASGLLDVLNEPGATLEGVCERVGVPIPTDLPAPDTRDLPPMQPPVGAVVGDAEGIPF